MDKKEIYKELQMTYDDLQQYLIQKYGAAQYDYFATPECRSKNKKVTRTGEGLYCHHMDEDKGGSLGNPSQARMQPYAWQRKERLVYCNILEHLILHIKIAVLRQKSAMEKPDDVNNFFTTGGIFMICGDINDMFINDGTSLAWRKRCFEEIKDNYEDYIILLKALLTYIDNNYAGDKSGPAFLRVGGIAHFYDGYGEVTWLSPQKDKLIMRFSTGDRYRFSSYDMAEQFKYADHIELIRARLASGSESFYENIYDDIINCGAPLADEYAGLLKGDYRGHGYVRYAHIELGEEFGSKNADEYISNALPMYSEENIDLGETPVFWRGPDIPAEAEDAFYIVRIETMFNIKDGAEPFVRFRGVDLMRGIFRLDMTDDHNFKDKGWTVLSTSDVYDPRRKVYSSQYVDIYGSVKDATIILSLGRDDYLLFRERYNIRYLKILDGCYFS